MKIITCTSFGVYSGNHKTTDLVILRQDLGFKNLHVAAARVGSFGSNAVAVTVGHFESNREFQLKVVKAKRK